MRLVLDRFEQLADELRAFGAPEDLARRALVSRDDEVRHARMTRALAERFWPGPLTLVLRGGDHPGRVGEADVILERGRRLVERANCRGCHVIENQGGGMEKVLEGGKPFAPPVLVAEFKRLVLVPRKTPGEAPAA